MTAEAPRYMSGEHQANLYQNVAVCVCSSELLRDALNPDGCFSFQKWAVTAASCSSLPSPRLSFGDTHCWGSQCIENPYSRVERCRRKAKMQEIIEQRLGCCVRRGHWRHVPGSRVLAGVGWEVVMVSEHLLCS